MRIKTLMIASAMAAALTGGIVPSSAKDKAPGQPAKSVAVAEPVGTVTASLPNPSDQSPAEAEFTPLDEIDRVRREGCGIDQFEQFLGWYTSSTNGGGWLEQVVWTNYMVKVASLADPAAEGRWVDRQAYLGQFRIDSYDYRFLRRPASLDPGSDHLRLTLTRVNDKRYRVDWHNSSGSGFAGVEGEDQNKKNGAYIFEYKKDCWYLTEDLR